MKILCGVVAAVVALSACSGPGDFTVYGHVVVEQGIGDGADGFTAGQACNGETVYSSIHQGVTLSIEDPGGKVLAADLLGAGYATTHSLCVFDFAIGSVPDRKGTYIVRVADQPTQPFTRAQMTANDFTVLFN